MITVTANSITMPIGETGVIQFSFKNQLTNEPYLLINRDLDHEIIFKFGNDSNDLLFSKIFKIEKDKDDDKSWEVFNTAIVENKESDSALLGDTNTEGWEKYTLYKVHLKDNPKTYAWQYIDDDNNLHTYDYENSSIDVQFDREDTNKLSAKTYYCEIVHLAYDSDKNVVFKNTLLKKTEIRLTEVIDNEQ